MFEHFSDASRTVVVRAQDEAKLLLHGVIGRTHLTLGILRTAPAVLEDLGGSRDKAQGAAFVEHSWHGRSTGHLPFAANVREVFNTARVIAAVLGSPLIEPEHLAAALAVTSRADHS